MAEQKEKIVKKETKDIPMIFPKLINIMRNVGAISKDRKNEAQKYSFRGVDDVYCALHDILAKEGVITIPNVLGERVEEYKSPSGKTVIYRILKIRYRFCAEDGSSVDTTVIGEGMDWGDKAANKAMSVAHKYALLQTFLIPTDDPKDSEIDSPEVNGKPQQISDDPFDNAAYEGDRPSPEEYKTITITHFDGKKYKISKFEALDLFKKMKEQIGKDAYYEILGAAGYEKSNQIPPKKIPAIYALMVEAYQGK